MDLNQATNYCIQALKQAYFKQRELLDDGTINAIVQVKSEGLDQPTKGDWESEEAVMGYLGGQKFEGNIYSEEHGLFEFGGKYLVILDGIDGSSALAKNPNTRCGTMLTLADNPLPKYDNFVFAGVTEFTTNRIIYAIKGEGVWEITNPGENESIRQLPSFKPKPFSKDLGIKIDCYMQGVDYQPGITAGLNDFEQFMDERVVSKLNGRMRPLGSISSSAHCIDLLVGEDTEGNKVDAVAQIIAKGSFESPAIYTLVRELGGVGTDLQGNDLGPKKWGPMKDKVEGCVFSSSQGIHDSIISYLK